MSEVPEETEVLQERPGQLPAHLRSLSPGKASKKLTSHWSTLLETAVLSNERPDCVSLFVYNEVFLGVIIGGKLIST